MFPRPETSRIEPDDKAMDHHDIGRDAVAGSGRAPQREATPRGSELRLRTLASRASRGPLSTTGAESKITKPTVADIRRFRSETCHAAHAHGIRAERVVVKVKEGWTALGSARGYHAEVLADVSAAVMTACIQDHFASPDDPSA